jgi:hypothetical protein
MVQDRVVKVATAVGHLMAMGETATERLRLRESDIGWPLEELWVGGALLDKVETIESSDVVLVLDVPAEEVPWLALHPAGEWAGSQLRLGKIPFVWCYRPLLWPAWNHRYRRVVRFWSAKDGLDHDVVEAIRERRLDDLVIVEPTTADLVEQLRAELDVSRRHLRRVLDGYWDSHWRREHRGYDGTPEDHLWRAAQGVREIEDALTELNPR